MEIVTPFPPEQLESRRMWAGASAPDIEAVSLVWDPTAAGVVFTFRAASDSYPLRVPVRLFWSEDYGAEKTILFDGSVSAAGLRHAFTFHFGPSSARPANSSLLVAQVDPIHELDERDEGNNQASLAFSRALVLVTHGWNPAGRDSSWPANIRNEIALRLEEASSAAEHQGRSIRRMSWNNRPSADAVHITHNQQIDVVSLTWSGAQTLDPWTAASKGQEIGLELGEQIYNFGYASMHLIGHSAGSWLIDGISDKIKTFDALSGRFTYLQLTFLDAFAPEPTELADHLTDDDWAEHYVHTGFLPWTNEILPHAFNIDLTTMDPTPESFFTPTNGHAWPWEWYLQSAKNPTDLLFQGWGLARSVQWNDTRPSFVSFPRGGFIEHTVRPTRPGDANGNGQFNRQDIVQVLQAGKYLSHLVAAWHEGDWNGDGFFDQLDLVAALTDNVWAG